MAKQLIFYLRMCFMFAILQQSGNHNKPSVVTAPSFVTKSDIL